MRNGNVGLAFENNLRWAEEFDSGRDIRSPNSVTVEESSDPHWCRQTMIDVKLLYHQSNSIAYSPFGHVSFVANGKVRLRSGCPPEMAWTAPTK